MLSCVVSASISGIDVVGCSGCGCIQPVPVMRVSVCWLLECCRAECLLVMVTMLELYKCVCALHRQRELLSAVIIALVCTFVSCT